MSTRFLRVSATVSGLCLLAAICIWTAGCGGGESINDAPVAPIVDEDTGLLTIQGAIDIVLAQVVTPIDESDLIVARVCKTALTAGDVINAEMAAGEDGESRTSLTNEWFFWVDDNPLAYFGHGNRWVFVDRLTHEVTSVDSQDVPVLNGTDIWYFSDGSDDGSSIIYDNTGIDLAAAKLSAITQDNGPVLAGAEPTKIAIIIYNTDKGPLQKDIEDNVLNMAAGLKKHGYEVPEFDDSKGSGKKQPAIFIGDKKGTGIQQLQDFVSKYQCSETYGNTEFVIYYTGHGKRRNGRYYFGLRSKFGSAKKLYSEDLAGIIAGLGSQKIYMMLDCCRSGGIAPDLRNADGVHGVWTSCEDDEKSYSGWYDNAVHSSSRQKVTDPYPRSAGEVGSEYTSGWIKWFNDNTYDPSRSTADLMAGCHTTALANDLMATAGITHPTGP